jgi:hypothetical protein
VLDAVEAAVKIMEDDEAFNAGEVLINLCYSIFLFFYFFLV